MHRNQGENSSSSLLMRCLNKESRRGKIWDKYGSLRTEISSYPSINPSTSILQAGLFTIPNLICKYAVTYCYLYEQLMSNIVFHWRTSSTDRTLSFWSKLTTCWNWRIWWFVFWCTFRKPYCFTVTWNTWKLLFYSNAPLSWLSVRLW